MDEEKSKEELLIELRELRDKIRGLERKREHPAGWSELVGESQPETEFGRKYLEAIRAKDFLQGILDSSTLVSVVLTDLDQNVLFWNSGAENIFGYTPEEMIGSKITKLYPTDSFSKEIVDQLRQMVRNKNGAVCGKMEQITKGGSVLTISLALSPMVDPAGEVQGILGVGLDVTEEVRQQKQILDLLNQVKCTQDVAVFSLAKLAESRDEETGSHLVRIQKYCRALCERLARTGPYSDVATERYSDDLISSSVLHDIGKVGLPDSVLLSTGKLTVAEREIMKRHTLVGGKALEDAVSLLGQESFLSMGMEVAYHHHEKWDGTGYPFGLKGQEIPLSARIVALADVYDALTSPRRYKQAFSHEETRSIILKESGTQFDPDLVDAFDSIESEFRRIRDSISDAAQL
ncbi:MAG: PAS domain S-box protein [Desulfomonile tiedjei]|uniref:PAS domain S-box protein n=1 Tax=Desulfomonile tiedjei TaxID=2358 RepID=A0A9D6V7L2_9BACT|nr:PAS domain S-box protein [Desulfomonile tiedjei]